MFPQLEIKFHQRKKQFHKHFHLRRTRIGNLTSAIQFHRMPKKQKQQCFPPSPNQSLLLLLAPQRILLMTTLVFHLQIALLSLYTDAGICLAMQFSKIKKKMLLKKGTPFNTLWQNKDNTKFQWNELRFLIKCFANFTKGRKSNNKHFL